MDIDDYITRERDEEQPVTYCECCGEELYSIDTIIKQGEATFCSYDCLLVGEEIMSTDLKTVESCCFCGEKFGAGETVLQSSDGSVFCDKYCIFGGLDLEEVRGYDL